MTRILDVLREKQSRGVKQIRVTSVIDMIEQEGTNGANGNQPKQPKPRGVEKLVATVKGADLVGTAEAATILGVERPRIGRWQDKCRFCGASENRGEWEKPCMDAEAERKGGYRGHVSVMPDPVVRLASGPIWLRAQIEGMQGERERRRRRRPGETDE